MTFINRYVKTTPTTLKVGDRIRITGQPPWADDPKMTLHKDTRTVFNKLAKRGRSVRIFMIDEYGCPWYRCKFRRKNGQWEYHHLTAREEDGNWVKVKSRK